MSDIWRAVVAAVCAITAAVATYRYLRTRSKTSSRHNRYGAVTSATLETTLPSTAAALASDTASTADGIDRVDARLRYTQLKAMMLLAAAEQRKRRSNVAAPAEDACATAAALLQAYPPYDASDASLPSLRRFAHVREHTHCIFARRSRCFGSPAARRQARESGPVAEQVRAALPGLVDFTLQVKDAYPQLRQQGAHTGSAHLHTDLSTLFTAQSRSLLQWSAPLSAFALDAFVLEIAGAQYGDTVDHFAATVREALCTLSAADPVMMVHSKDELDSLGVDVRAAQCMATALAVDSASSAASAAAAAARASETFSSSRWHFSFLGETFFVTAFAPCYPRTGHARYMFTHEARAKAEEGDEEQQLFADFDQRCYVLLQPELSFLRHNLSADHPHTAWEQPRTERDRIRVAFHEAGRGYKIPETVAYAAAHFIVPPLDTRTGRIIAWWMKQDTNTGSA